MKPTVEGSAPAVATAGHKEVWTAQACVAELQRVATLATNGVVTRGFFRKFTQMREQHWLAHFGTFEEFRRQAGLTFRRGQGALVRHVSKHASVDHYRTLGGEAEGYAEAYQRPSSRRFQTLLVGSDIHDIEADPFWLHVFLDTARRVQPEIIVLNGDVWDAPEFGKYSVDPREWDVIGRINFVHERILRPLREACPDAQIDWIGGNHEQRLLTHLADATPALRSILADLHGFTVGTLLGLDRFEVNYISKGDLAVFARSEANKQVARNYKTYFDCFLAHHFPEGMALGVPGTNGHHHRFKATPCHNETFGAYTWIQTGCGHRQDASYCNGEKWDMGFLLAHIDTQGRAVHQEYVPVSDFSVVGGQYYFREEIGNNARNNQSVVR
jgi:hypothetical protein